jgi:hypothetical protein
MFLLLRNALTIISVGMEEPVTVVMGALSDSDIPNLLPVVWVQAYSDDFVLFSMFLTSTMQSLRITVLCHKRAVGGKQVPSILLAGS